MDEIVSSFTKYSARINIPVDIQSMIIGTADWVQDAGTEYTEYRYRKPFFSG